MKNLGTPLFSFPHGGALSTFHHEKITYMLSFRIKQCAEISNNDFKICGFYSQSINARGAIDRQIDKVSY